MFIYAKILKHIILNKHSRNNFFQWFGTVESNTSFIITNSMGASQTSIENCVLRESGYLCIEFAKCL